MTKSQKEQCEKARKALQPFLRKNSSLWLVVCELDLYAIAMDDELRNEALNVTDIVAVAGRLSMANDPRIERIGSVVDHGSL